VSEPLVRLDRVEFGYERGRAVLSDCSFCLHRGERVGLVGPIGSGKTSLLRLVVGLTRPRAGRVEVFGRDRVHEADFHEVRRRIGYLFQDADDQLFCPTVLEDVAFGPLNLGKSRGEVRTIVAQTLAQLGLSGYEERIAYRLSGGEKRLVALAGVLAMQPEVLLLDEPTAGLDEVSADRVMDILCTLPQAMMIVSHDHVHLARIAHACWALSDGKLDPVTLPLPGH